MVNNNAVSAKIVADSISPDGIRITTFELEYPRIIHSELMTHRLFSRNAMSSRAVPIAKMIKQVRENPAMPYRFGANQPGMQDKGEEHNATIYVPRVAQDGTVSNIAFSGRAWWQEAAQHAAAFADAFDKAKYHKQIANRLLEPFQRMKTVLTATEFNNFWWLRVDADADPTIEVLATCMKEAFDRNTPEMLQPGMWHTPYVDHVYGFGDGEGEDEYIFEGYCVLDENDKPVMLSLEDAKAISASCCAQVSYRVLNSTKEKALDIYGKLLSGNKVHASPFEHQATPLAHVDQMVRRNFILSEVEVITQDTEMWEVGVTHVDRKGMFWSGNFRGWIQHRQLLDNNVISG